MQVLQSDQNDSTIVEEEETINIVDETENTGMFKFSLLLLQYVAAQGLRGIAITYLVLLHLILLDFCNSLCLEEEVKTTQLGY